MFSSKNTSNDGISPRIRQAPTAAENPEVIDKVEAAAEESFPASDPPGWTPLTVGPPTRALGDRADDCFSYDWPTTSTEADALRDTLRRLEMALAVVAPVREQDWTVRTLTELREVGKNLGRHSSGDDRSDSFLAGVDVTPRLARDGDKLCQEQADLLVQARMLLVLLTHEAQDESADFSAIRRRVELLLQALRHQEGKEQDLIFEGLCTDTGAGD